MDDRVADSDAIRAICVPAVCLPHVRGGIGDRVHCDILVNDILRFLNQVCPFRRSTQYKNARLNVTEITYHILVESDVTNANVSCLMDD